MRFQSLSRHVRRAFGVALTAAFSSFAQAGDKESVALLPQTLSRDGGQVTVRANPLGPEVIKVDGKLNEAIYSRFAPASDCSQA